MSIKELDYPPLITWAVTSDLSGQRPLATLHRYRHFFPELTWDPLDNNGYLLTSSAQRGLFRRSFSLVLNQGAVIGESIHMAYTGPLERVDDYRWRIPRSYKPGMRTDAIIFASEDMVPSLREDNAPEQAANVATLPGIVGSSLAMPDIHWGYGFPIGGVAAMDAEEGVISPGGIGFDINCGVRLVRTNLEEKDVRPHIKELISTLFKNVPAGVGSKGVIDFSGGKFDDVLQYGAEWAVDSGYGWKEDLVATEEGGRMDSADPSKVSSKAKQRGIPQIGSLGSGNHFLEVDVVEKIFDEEAAKAFGLREGQVTVTVHCGSRGAGHQIATDYLQTMERSVRKTGIVLPDGLRPGALSGGRGLLQGDVLRRELCLGQSPDDPALDQGIVRRAVPRRR